MSPTKASLILILYSLTYISTVTAQGRSPHGVANEYPMALSPLAYEFFNPTAQKANPCETGCSPMPLAAQVEAIDQAQARSQRPEMLTNQKGGAGLGPGGTAGVVFGLALAVLLAMGAYRVVVARRGNADRVKTVRPDV